MNNHQPMTEQRVCELIDAWGSDSERWPEGERVQALELLQASPALQARRREAEALDAMLGGDDTAADPVHIEQLSARIMQGLPAQPSPARRPAWSERLQGWFGNLRGGAVYGLGTFASVLVIMFVTMLVVDFSEFSAERYTVASSEFDRWAWEQTTGEAVNGDNGDPVDNMVSMLAPELSAGDNDL